MVKIEEFTSAGILYTENKDFEIVNISSERNLLHDFKSLTFNYGFNLETKIRNVLSSRFKELEYKILVIGDESFNSLEIKKVIILLKNEEEKACVMNSITEKNLDFGIISEKVVDKKLTLFKQNCIKWCDNIQNYLANSFGFTGITKINASAYDGNLISFNIVITGKGTNDNIVFVMKEISKAMNDVSLSLSEDEIYTFINNYFN